MDLAPLITASPWGAAHSTASAPTILTHPRSLFLLSCLQTGPCGCSPRSGARATRCCGACCSATPCTTLTWGAHLPIGGARGACMWNSLGLLVPGWLPLDRVGVARVCLPGAPGRCWLEQGKWVLRGAEARGGESARRVHLQRWTRWLPAGGERAAAAAAAVFVLRVAPCWPALSSTLVPLPRPFPAATARA